MARAPCNSIGDTTQEDRSPWTSVPATTRPERQRGRFRIQHRKQDRRGYTDDITEDHQIRLSWHGHHDRCILWSAGPDVHRGPPPESSKMAPLFPRTTPLAAAVLSCIYVNEGGGADGRTPPEVRNPVQPSGPAVARPTDPHPNPAPKPGARSTPHHTRCRRAVGGTRPSPTPRALVQGMRMAALAFPATAVLPYIYVNEGGGGADGHTPSVARTPIRPPGPAVARPAVPHPDPTPKPGSRSTPHPLPPRRRWHTPSTYPTPLSPRSTDGHPCLLNRRVRPVGARAASRVSDRPARVVPHVQFVIDTRSTL